MAFYRLSVVTLFVVLLAFMSVGSAFEMNLRGLLYEKQDSNPQDTSTGHMHVAARKKATVKAETETTDVPESYLTVESVIDALERAAGDFSHRVLEQKDKKEKKDKKKAKKEKL